MAGSKGKSDKRKTYFSRLFALLEQYPRVLVVEADHVGSKQMADIRLALRGKAVVLMGKNTMIRTALKQKMSEMPQLEKLLPLVRLNVGFIFCIEDPAEVRKIVSANKVPAPARQGVFAPIDVFIPAGPTGMDPGSTSFFQALGIATKIVKGQIEIQTEVHLIKEGDKVTASAATLLQKLGIKPFEYGLAIQHVYDDGSVYKASVLDITDEVILDKFRTGTMNVAALSREIGMPTTASAPHSILEAFKFCTSLVLESDYTFPQMQRLKDILENPDAFVVAAAAPAAGAAAVEAPKEEEPEEEEDDMGFSLFD
ncbi:60S acidic ribosomal protein P0 [Neospora caninum Liverpool]|uniref:60S acidic ribosomal protein P0 n=2 Tax=Neospora caninum TaxID=29176 RepID=F0VPW1_NEOCL|nr:60S acidic ribosomal protein P0 [Neospora caninum Liverpool]BAF62528.1 ribosomal phosphoprotein P0 [Neospora caninum]CBZ55758.1 60S acidic ribosomal protein P0 [Neospora caninum Liverpool]CEL70501.1 TPA: 60S acidic ribosomal protein P0 [Neospora caninum Liverpool]|eukprot:XP_003885784.1 60S acidic ribosomal protein P0 [Neospora caninum Liverpool]